MSKRDPGVSLHQILAYSREAVGLCQGKSRQDLDHDRLLNLALTRLLEMIGEAANRVPDEVRSQYPELPWTQMIAARNRLIHGYDSIDFDILWAIINSDLPVLINQLEKIVGNN
jgi:uncharacterized protein with HEPN domain